MNVNFLKGPGNLSLDLMRLGGAFVIFLAYPFPFVWEALKHGTVPDPAAYGVGWATVIGAVGVAIGAKDICVAKALSTTASVENNS